MRIRCPYCRKKIKPMGLKPGQFTPRCPRCEQAFLVEVASDDSVLVKTLDPALEAAGSTRPGTTLPAPEFPETDDGDEADFRFESPVPSPGSSPLPSPSAATRIPSSRESSEEAEIPSRLGGFEILRTLGKGGMGTVYLARQISLDRLVALKVLRQRWADDTTFLARFTREARAAARLSHHNVVQIYDVGEDNGLHFFSMEYVQGKNLAVLLRERGQLPAEEAVGYVIQAARGLKFAHEQSMIHRDVKPENLILNDQGVLKVADLGLVKTPGEGEETSPVGPPGERLAFTGPVDVTNAGLTVGTPAFMSPEQARNASQVDLRADIYSLGCSLYYLLTGQPPFRGVSATEVLLKQIREQPEPIHRYAKEVPREVAAVVRKMMAKDPDERHQDMAAVIEDLERALGNRQENVGPGEWEATILSECVRQYNRAPTAILRSGLLVGILALLVVATLVTALISLRLAFCVVLLGLLTTLAGFILDGLTGHSSLFSRVREYLGAAGWIERGVWLLMLAGLLGVPWLLGLGYHCLVCLGIAVVLAACWHFLITRPLRQQRQPALEKADKLVSGLRLQGVSEDVLRKFVCRNSGRDFEEFFEDLFGYDALLWVRAYLLKAEGDRPRPRHATWRDPIMRWFAGRVSKRKQAG